MNASIAGNIVVVSARLPSNSSTARPICHYKRQSIDAHLTIVFAALAVGRLIEDRTSYAIKKFVRTTRRYCTIHIRAGNHLLTAEDPLSTELRHALTLITEPRTAH